ncbi:MAG TPA: YIP1 family protein [Vicinamibacterales bacterium]|nr:YIP1 family protein [Vicinamibacterales bacterium]
MNSTATAAGATPAPKGLLARFVGIITAPKDTFASIVPVPKWLGILALTTVIVALFTALPLTTEAGRQAAIDTQVQQMQSFGVTVSDQMYQQMENRSKMMPYTTGISILVVTPIFAVIIAGILFAIFNAALGGEASFKQVFTVLAHAGAVSALSAIFSGTINYFRGAMGSVANLGALLPMLPEKSFVANLLGAIDVFLIWYIVVLAMGLAVLYRRRTQPIAIALMGVYAVIAIVIAVVKSRAGGA